MKYASTSKSLRPYQQELLGNIRATLQYINEPIMMQLPTGGGKTVIAAHLLRDYLTGRRKAVWLTHRKELASQTENMLFNAGISATSNIKWTPGTKAPRIANGVVILMAQTVGRRTRDIAADVWGNYDVNDLLIIDEAHHAVAKGWERAIHQWPGKVLGMTATPWRLSRKEGFDHLFGNNLILGPQVGELQNDEFLCQANVLVPGKDNLILGGKVASHLDYTEKGIEAANTKEVMTARALKFWKEHVAQRQTIVYAVSIGHAENLAALFSEEGIPAEAIHTKTDADTRAQAISNFANGRLSVLVNVAIATEGFDLPDASCIVIARPTKSLSLYLQMVGRGLRPKSDGGNCLILDLAGNALEHGLPEDAREWSLAARGESESARDMPVVLCEQCQTTSPAASHSCRSCGAPFGKDCLRCGKWRAFRSGWLLEDLCGSTHEPVCDHCHIDVHVQYNLPFVFSFQQESQEDLYFKTNLVYENPRIVARALLSALLKIGGKGATKDLISKVKGILYENQCSGLKLNGNKKDLERSHSSIDLKGLTQLPSAEQSRQSFMFIYTGCFADKSIEKVYERLGNSGFCVSKPEGKK